VKPTHRHGGAAEDGPDEDLEGVGASGAEGGAGAFRPFLEGIQ